MGYLLLLLSVLTTTLTAQTSTPDKAIARYYRNLEPAVPRQWQGFPVWESHAEVFAALPDCSPLEETELQAIVEAQQQQAVEVIELGWWWQQDRYHWVYRLRLAAHPDCWLYYQPCTGEWLEYYCRGE